MLDVDNVVAFLLDLGLIEAAWIVDGEITIRSVTRRNRNLRVEGPGGVGYLIKQPEIGNEGQPTLRAEADFLESCRSEPAAAGLVRNLPRLIHSDVSKELYIYELIPDAVTLLSLWWSRADVDRCERAACDVGQVLGRLHEVYSLVDGDGGAYVDRLPRVPTWVFDLHRPNPTRIAGMSRASLELLHLLQSRAEFGDRLDALRRDWECRTVIHGDVKLDNILVGRSGPAGASDRVGIYLVDWEMVQLGDPAWDLSGAFQNFLFLWVDSMPDSDELAADQMIAKAGMPLSAVRNATRALWLAYRGTANLEPVEIDRFLLRAVTYSAARLIQSAYEISQGMDSLTGRATLLLQLSANLFAEPERGQVELYGILRGTAA